MILTEIASDKRSQAISFMEHNITIRAQIRAMAVTDQRFATMFNAFDDIVIQLPRLLYYTKLISNDVRRVWQPIMLLPIRRVDLTMDEQQLRIELKKITDKYEKLIDLTIINIKHTDTDIFGYCNAIRRLIEILWKEYPQ